MKSLINFFGCSLLTAVFVGPALGQSTWDGGGSDAKWDTAENWDSDSVPAAGGNIVFTTDLASGTTIDLNGNRTVNSIRFEATSATSSEIGLSNNSDTLFLNSGVFWENSMRSVRFRPTVDFGSNNTRWEGNGSKEFYVEGDLVGAGTITKAGTHTLRLSGNNSLWTGGLVLEQGNVNLGFRTSEANIDHIFGTGSVTFKGSGTSVQLNRSGAAPTWNNHFINDSSGNANFRFTGGTQRGGVVNLAGNVSTGANVVNGSRMSFNARVGFNTTNFAEGRWNLSGDWSGYTPGGSPVVAVGDGTLQIDAQQAVAPTSVAYAFDPTANRDVSSNSRVESGIGTQTSKLIINGALVVANDVRFSNASNPTLLPVGEAEQSVGATHSSGIAEISGDVSFNNVGATNMNLFSQESGATLKVSGNIGGSATSGTLQINKRYSYAWGTNPPGAHEVAWRNPTGTVELTGNNTYTIPTVVEAGTLLVNNSTGSGTGSGTVTVGSGATLGGSGTVGGLTTVESGGTLSPGASPGIMTYESGLLLKTGSSLLWEMTSDTENIGDRGTLFDGIDVTGGIFTVESGVDFDLVFNLAGSTVDFTSMFWDSERSWLVIDNTNVPSVSGNIFDLGTVSADSLGSNFSSTGGSFSFSQTGNGIYLNYTPVPEPTTLGLLGFLLGGLGFWHYRRRRNLCSQNGTDGIEEA